MESEGFGSSAAYCLLNKYVFTEHVFIECMFTEHVFTEHTPRFIDYQL